MEQEQKLSIDTSAEQKYVAKHFGESWREYLTIIKFLKSLKLNAIKLHNVESLYDFINDLREENNLENENENISAQEINEIKELIDRVKKKRLASKASRTELKSDENWMKKVDGAKNNHSEQMSALKKLNKKLDAILTL